MDGWIGNWMDVSILNEMKTDKLIDGWVEISRWSGWPMTGWRKRWMEIQVDSQYGDWGSGRPPSSSD